MAIPILNLWKNYFSDPDEGLGSSYERIIINKKMEEICRRFKVEKVLEAPSFGFTGTSGINSMDLAKRGFNVSLIDHDEERTELIKKLWSDFGLSLDARFQSSYSKLPFSDNEFGFSWNFSALWFVEDLEMFLQELTRITERAIVLCVPNRAGIGYLSQKFLGKDDLKKYLKEENIMPKNFKKIMKNLNWELIKTDFIDCPPWPDIGMPKEKFLKIFGLGWLVKIIQKDEPVEEKAPLTILDYFAGKDDEFPKEMLKYSWFEKLAPWIIKRFWAHHRYFLFVPKEVKK